MVVLENGKMKMDKPRFNLNVILECNHLPNCDIKQDVKIVENKQFNTLRDIAEYLNLTYHIVVGIYHKKTKGKGDKWLNKPLCPTISIDKLE